MKPIITLLLSALLFIGCTNQPVSRNKKLPTKDLLGFWQPAKGDIGYVLTQGSDGTASAEQVMYNRQAKKFEYIDNALGACYFKTLKKDGRSYNFMSVGEADGYRTFLYSFDKKKRLVLQEIDYDFIARTKNTAEGELQKFSAPGYFTDFLQVHLGNNKLFDESISFQKRKSMKDFSKPGKG